jgi:hydrogenase maturation protease
LDDNSFPVPDLDPRPEWLVLGVGNPAVGDDGAGVRIIELLSGMKLPPHVTVQQAGLPGWELPTWLENRSNVILVDAIQMGEIPGTWKRFRFDDIQVQMENGALSLHQPDLACGLALSQALGFIPENLLIYGIEPEVLDFGASLSPVVLSKLPEIIANILQDVEKIKV